jgi:choline dehydrogenase-like flavoprotein
VSLPPEYRIDYPNVTDGSALSGHRTFDCDVVVVGTGAGGATAAARLRAGGRDVLMLEEGGLHKVDSYTTDPTTMIQRLYRDAGTAMILGRPPIIFAEGRCVGGSTVINGGMSWRTPPRVLEQWERDLGLDGTGPKAMDRYFDEAERILHVEPNNEDTFGKNTHLFVKGATALGWPKLARAPRNMNRCVGSSTARARLDRREAGHARRRYRPRCTRARRSSHARARVEGRV